MKFSILLLIVALFSSTARAAAARDYPVYVTIEGQGALRFRLWTGRACFAEHGNVFDGWLAPGSYRFVVHASSVGYQYTSGAFREVNWSTPQRAPSEVGPVFALRPVEIVVRTD